MSGTPPLRSAAAALVVALAAACGPGGTEERPTVRIAVTPFLSYGPVFIAVDEGFFADEGLEAELVVLADVEAAAALTRGDVDVVANFLISGVFNLIHRGAGIALVADKGHAAEGACVANGLVVSSRLAPAGELPALEALRGRSLDVRPGGVEEYWVERLLGAHGLSLADLLLDRVPWTAKMEALRAGSIDLTAWSEPNLTRAVREGVGAVLAGAGEVMPGGQWAFILYGRSLLEERRELGERVMVAYLRGVRRYNRGTTERNVAILARHTGLDEELVRSACWMAVRDDGRIDVASVLEFQRWAVRRGYQDEVVPPEVFWEPAFSERATATLAARGEQP